MLLACLCGECGCNGSVNGRGTRRWAESKFRHPVRCFFRAEVGRERSQLLLTVHSRLVARTCTVYGKQRAPTFVLECSLVVRTLLGEPIYQNYLVVK